MRQQVFLGQLSSAGLLLTVASLFYGRVFDGPTWIGPVIGAVLLGGALSLTLGRTSMPAPFRVLAVGLTGVLFVTLAVLIPSADFPGLDRIGDVLYGATIDGWRNALDSTLPIDPGLAEPLGFVTSLAWIAGSVTGSLLNRPDGTALPVIPGIVFAALSLPLAAPSGIATYFLIAALVASALLLSLVRAVPEARLTGDARTRVTEFVGERMLTERLISGVPVLVVLGLLAPLAADYLPAGRDDPFDPRTLRVEEIRSTSAVNPLAEIKARRSTSPPEPVFLLDLPSAPPAALFDRVGLVALDIYDGANWTTDATYSATSRDLAPATDVAVESLEVRQVVDVTTADLPWIPAGVTPVEIDGDDIWYDRSSGTLLLPDGPRALTYEVVSRIAVPTEDELRTAALDLRDTRYLDLPSIPGDANINLLGDRLTGPTDYDRLVALETALRDQWTFVLDSSSGTSIGRIEQFLVEGEGYRDQFVSAFAVAARQRGFPTRIMVGYRISEQIEDNTEVLLETITSAQYDAWPEVRFEGIGWVPFDPVPETSGEPQVSEEDAQQIPEGQAVSQGPTPREADPEEDDTTQEDESTVGTTVRILIISALFLLLFPVVLLLLVMLIKYLRRRWRENLDDPTERVLAGWQESKDRLLEAGVVVSPDMTIKEIVAASRRDLGVHASSSLSTIAPLVTSAIYAPHPPSPQVADLVWDEVELFDRQLNETRTRIQAARAKVDPRPLLESV